MVTAQSNDNKKLVSKCSTVKLGDSCVRSEDIKIPVYCFGTQYAIANSLFEGLPDMSYEQSLLDSLLLAQWEVRMWKGHFKYDVTASEIKVIRGKCKFLAQLSSHCHMDSSQDDEKHKFCHQEDLLVFNGTKHCEDILFCIRNNGKASSELVSSASVPSGSFLVVANVNPIEYGHVFLVPHGFEDIFQVMDAISLEMVAKFAVEMNNFSFRMFYDSPGTATSHPYFQACYFPDLLPVENMLVDTLCGEGYEDGGIRISTLVDYPIKTLIFESNCDLKLLIEVLAETCSFLLDKSILYNLMICDQGKKIFMFLQGQAKPMNSGLNAWECAGYFSFRTMKEFDHVSESVLLKRLNSFSLDEEAFKTVKQFCYGIATKIAA